MPSVPSMTRHFRTFIPTPLPFSARTARRPRPTRSFSACAQQPPPRNHTLISWNINSLRALLRKNPLALEELDNQYHPDVLCLQETKLQKQHEKLFAEIIPNLDVALFNSSTARLGYSGTAILSRPVSSAMMREINHEAGDREGRIIMLEYPGLFLVNVYTMNSGTQLRRLPLRLTWDSAFRQFVRRLRDMGKPVLVLGDLNVARSPHDVFDTDAAQGIPGFSDEERQSFEDTLETCGLVDAYRMLHPVSGGGVGSTEHGENSNAHAQTGSKQAHTPQFTYWDYRSAARERNDGWRIDYVLASDDMIDAVRDVRILDNVFGSDHCPIAVELAPGLLA